MEPGKGNAFISHCFLIKILVFSTTLDHVCTNVTSGLYNSFVPR